jgi:hypothetical protein
VQSGGDHLDNDLVRTAWNRLRELAVGRRGVERRDDGCVHCAASLKA